MTVLDSISGAGSVGRRLLLNSDSPVSALYTAAVAFITGFSFYDTYLVYKYRRVIEEQNEICKWLIELEPTNVSVFIAAKVLGTLMVALALLLLGRYWQRGGAIVTASLVCFQVGLGYYLHYTEPVPSKQFQLAAQEVSAEARSRGVPIVDSKEYSELEKSKPELKKSKGRAGKNRARGGGKRMRRNANRQQMQSRPQDKDSNISSQLQTR